MIVMCETAVISRHIVKIGRKSYDRRLRIASPNYEEKRGELPRLLNEVDKLSNILHNEFHTITAEDYAAFAQELNIVINTLKSLYQERFTTTECYSKLLTLKNLTMILECFV